MAATYFDTHSYVKSLQTAGVPIEQAEAHAKALNEAVTSELVRRSDLQEVKLDMSARLAELKGKLDLPTWMIGFNLAFSVAVLWRLLK